MVLMMSGRRLENMHNPPIENASPPPTAAAASASIATYRVLPAFCGGGERRSVLRAP